MSEPPGDRTPISWEALAAELASGLGEPDEGEQPAPAEAWDTVAARLAARLHPPAGAQQPVATEGPVPEPAPLARSPRSDPVELVAVDRFEWSVEEQVPPQADVRPAEVPPVEVSPVEPFGADEPAAQAEPADPWALRGGLEALLFVVDAPVDESTLANALSCTVGQVRDELTGLAADYDQRHAGVTLRRVGEGWRVYTREEHGSVVERYLLEGQRSRLTQAALETLAVIAYRQPVTRARVSAIRGVGVDAVVRTLVNRGLIYECGSDPDSGGGLYATTPLFLERLGLTGLDELPELAPLLPETSSVLDEHPDA